MNRTRNGRGGYSLVELALSAALLTIVMGSMVLFGGRSSGALSAGASQAELDARLRRTVARIGDELLPSGWAVITPDPIAPAGARSLSYSRSDGAINGRNTWGALRRLAFAYEVGELDDGLDNNGNGLADEGVVEWTIDLGEPTEQRVILSHGVRELDGPEQENDLDDDGDGLVDESGLAFQRSGNLLLLSLTLERVDAEHRTLVRTLETVLQPRN